MVILQAPPGSGKTTRVPLQLMDLPFLGGRSIIMLEPRRIAATNAARWMSSQCGEEVGGTVGYSIRFNRKVSRSTRIEIVTEGILTRRLQHDPELSRVGLVIFDEFHERSLHADLALALCRDVQQSIRPDLRILVMSATLSAATLSKQLGGAPVVCSTGRTYPVEIRYREVPSNVATADSVARGVADALAGTEGDILAFLPGRGDILRCARLLETMLGGGNLPLVVPLYGDLPFEQQEKAILPASRRKVVLATNIAETSLTIENVRVVVDGGWCKELRFSPSRGLNALQTLRISKASADQRAGRAGREAPGTCYRLWSQHLQQSLVDSSPPEILVSDLSQLVLEVSAWGIKNPGQLQWVDEPPAAAIEEACSLLRLLGALDIGGGVTSVGRRMLDTGLHPRLARLLVEAEDTGMAAIGADLAALLSERDIMTSARADQGHRCSDSDVLDRLELLLSMRRGEGSGSGFSADRGALAAVERLSRHLRGKSGTAPCVVAPDVACIGRLCAVAWPDRVAMRRQSSDTFLMSSGIGSTLSSQSSVVKSRLLVALDVDAGRGADAIIRVATSVDLEDIRELFARSIDSKRLVEWDQRQGRVVARQEERFGALLLRSFQLQPEPQEVTTALLNGLRQSGGSASLPWSDAALRFLARVRFLARELSEEEWPDFSFSSLDESLEQWLAPVIQGLTTIQSLAKIDLLYPLQAMLDHRQILRLREGAPESLQVPSGHRIALQYPEDGPPVLAVKLQEMFGAANTPVVAFGRVPVLVHLLSPAGRPLQVTRDLAGFWERGYPEVKKEMKGRYPRHPWPDDPWNAPATRKTSKRMGH